MCTVVGFPLGAMKPTLRLSSQLLISDGAGEIDMVLNVGWLKDGRLDDVRKDIVMVKEACQGHILKVILETCLLSDEEKVTACRLAMEGGADFVKTSTGFSTGGASEKDVHLMRSVVGDKLGVKASAVCAVMRRSDRDDQCRSEPAWCISSGIAHRPGSESKPRIEKPRSFAGRFSQELGILRPYRYMRPSPISTSPNREGGLVIGPMGSGRPNSRPGCGAMPPIAQKKR